MTPIFFPLAELRPQDANLYLVFLTSSHLLFQNPVQDDWYYATGNTTQVHKLQFTEWSNTTVFRQSEPGSPLACREQHQYCYRHKCTPLLSDWDAQYTLKNMVDKHDLISDDKDLPWVIWLMRTGFSRKQTIWQVLAKLHVHALTAWKYINGPMVGNLPDNQWQLEVRHWHDTSMAHLQGIFLDSVVGHSGPGFQRRLRTPGSATEWQICKNQVRTPQQL